MRPVVLTSLGEIQSLLQEMITDSSGLQAALERHDGIGQLRVQDWIRPARAPSAGARLNVYAEAYFFRLLESLSKDYSGVRTRVGEKVFHGLIADYLDEHPSAHASVSALGRHFPSFLESHPMSNAWPFLSDLARLEWSLLESHLSERLPPITQEAITAFAPAEWQNLIFHFQPCARLLALDGPVDRLEEDLSCDFAPAPTYLWLDRLEHQSRTHRVSHEEWRLGRSLIESRPLGEAIQEGMDPAFLGGMFTRWMSAGLICALSLLPGTFTE